MTPSEIPSASGRLVGGKLKDLREKAGKSVEDVADEMGMSRAAAYRRESGHTAVSLAEAEKYIRIYGAEGTAAESFVLSLIAGTRGPAWWNSFRDVMSQPQADIADLEAHAVSIRYYDPATITGVLQTPAYTDALFAPEKARITEMGLDFDQQVSFRNARKEILTSKSIHAVIGEAALRLEVGSPQVMREQAQHLADLIGKGVDIQILPFSAGYIAQISRSLILTSFEEGGAVYLEGAPVGQLVDDEGSIEKYERRFRIFSEAALPLKESADLLRTYYD